MNPIIKDVPGDGQCMFSSIAYVILTLEKSKYPNMKEVLKYARKLRKITVFILKYYVDNMNLEYIYSLAGSYNNLADVNDNSSNGNNLSKTIEKAYEYIEIMKKKCTWGGSIEMKALEKYIHALGYKGIQVYEKTNKSRYRVIKEMGTRKHKRHSKLIRILLEGVNKGGFHFKAIVNRVASIK